MDERRRVLVINHRMQVLARVKGLLVEQGYNVQTLLMHSVLCPIREIRSFAPDVILIDVVAGHGEDMILLEQLHADRSTRQIPVIAMSDDVFTLAQVERDYYTRRLMTLPLDANDLVRRVGAAVAHPEIGRTSWLPGPGAPPPIIP